MAKIRRDTVLMLKRENENLRTRNRRLETRLTRHQQAFRALNRMDETMRAMRPSFDMRKLINDLLAPALHACDSENGSMILVTVCTVVAALRHGALSLAVLAQIGGFLTPVLVGGEESNPHVLFGYLLVMNAGMFTLAYNNASSRSAAWAAKAGSAAKLRACPGFCRRDTAATI